MTNPDTLDSRIDELIDKHFGHLPHDHMHPQKDFLTHAKNLCVTVAVFERAWLIAEMRNLLNSPLSIMRYVKGENVGPEIYTKTTIENILREIEEMT